MLSAAGLTGGHATTPKPKTLSLAPPPSGIGKIRSPLPPPPNDPVAARIASTGHATDPEGTYESVKHSPDTLSDLSQLQVCQSSSFTWYFPFWMLLVHVIEFFWFNSYCIARFYSNIVSYRLFRRDHSVELICFIHLILIGLINLTFSSLHSWCCISKSEVTVPLITRHNRIKVLLHLVNSVRILTVLVLYNNPGIFVYFLVLDSYIKNEQFSWLYSGASQFNQEVFSVMNNIHISWLFAFTEKSSLNKHLGSFRMGSLLITYMSILTTRLLLFSDFFGSLYWEKQQWKNLCRKRCPKWI